MTTTKLNIDTAIERLGMGKFQYRLLISAGLVIASDTMEILLLSFLSLVVAEDWNLSDEQTSFITATAFIGALVGTLVLGYLADHVGRKPLFLFATATIALFGAMTATTQQYWQLLCTQFMVGFGVGGVTVPFDAIAELIPNQHRGKNLLILGYFWTLGTMTVPLLAWLGLREESSWRIFVLLCSIPCFLSTILTYFWVCESPRWLITQQRQDEAISILRKAATTNGIDPLKTFPEDIVLTDHSIDEEVHSMAALFRPEWRRMTLLLWGTWLGLAFLYWGTIQVVTLVFTETTEEDATTNNSSSSTSSNLNFDYAAIFSSSCAELVGQTMVIFMISWAGRAQITSLMYLLGGISIFVLCMAASQKESSRAMMIVLAFIARGLAMGASSMTWIVTAELLPTQVRTTGHAAANAIARLGGAVSPFLINESVDMYIIGTVMGCVSIATSVIAWNLPETRGIALGTAGKRELGSDGKPIHVSEII